MQIPGFRDFFGLNRMGKVTNTQEEKEDESYLDGKITLITQGGENLEGIRGRKD